MFVRSLCSLVAAGVALISMQSAARAQTAPATPMPAAGLPAPAKLDAQLPTLWIIGDSTVKNGTAGQVGWGDPLIKLFDLTRINVVNRAIGGRSSRTFLTEGRWDNVLQQMKAGDYVLMQFGHNDGGPLAGDNRERGSIRGVGDETKEVTLTLGANKDKPETVHTFGWYMKRYIADTRAKNATPILCSWVPHGPKGPVDPDAPAASYQQLAQQVAESEKVAFCDLFKTINQSYVAMKPDDVRAQFFAADNLHSTPAGAEHNAEVVAKDLLALKDVKLADYLTAEAKAKAAK